MYFFSILAKLLEAFQDCFRRQKSFLSSHSYNVSAVSINVFNLFTEQFCIAKIYTFIFAKDIITRAVPSASYFRKTGRRQNRKRPNWDMQKIVMRTRQELKMYHLSLCIGKESQKTPNGQCLYSAKLLSKHPSPQNYFQKNYRSAISMYLKSIGITPDKFV